MKQAVLKKLYSPHGLVTRFPEAKIVDCCKCGVVLAGEKNTPKLCSQMKLPMVKYLPRIVSGISISKPYCPDCYKRELKEFFPS